MSIIAAVPSEHAVGLELVARRRSAGRRSASALRRLAGCCSARASACRRSASCVLGGVAVGGLADAGAYGAFARGLVDGWADLLSSAPPADITEQFRALPFTVAWLAAAVGGEIAGDSRRPGLPASVRSWPSP